MRTENKVAVTVMPEAACGNGLILLALRAAKTAALPTPAAAAQSDPQCVLRR